MERLLEDVVILLLKFFIDDKNNVQFLIVKTVKSKNLSLVVD
jgi:hypothetical protein